MGRDNSWPAMVPNVVVISFYFSEAVHTMMHTMYTRCQPGNIQNGGTILTVTNLMADSESGSLDYCSNFLVTIRLSRLVSEIFACDGWMDNADHYYSWLPQCGGPAINITFFFSRALLSCKGLVDVWPWVFLFRSLSLLL